MLGADFEKESLDEYFLQKNQKLHYVDIVKRAKVTEIEKSSVPEVTHMSLIMQLQLIVEEQKKAVLLTGCQDPHPQGYGFNTCLLSGK